MPHKQTPTIAGRSTVSVDGIVRAAYKKLGRDKLTRKAMKLSFEKKADHRERDLEQEYATV